MDVFTDGRTLVLSGAFDARSTMQVRTAIYELLAGHDEDVVVDLTDVDLVDVATVEASRAGHHLRLRGAGPAVRRLLAKSRLIRVVELERQPA